MESRARTRGGAETRTQPGLQGCGGTALHTTLSRWLQTMRLFPRQLAGDTERWRGPQTFAAHTPPPSHHRCS